MKRLLRPGVLAVLTLGLWCMALASATWVVHTRHKARELFVELERLNKQRDALEIEWGQLQLEQGTWSSHAYVEQVAVGRLGMAEPRSAEIRVVTP